MPIEEEISQLKEAFREYIRLKIEEESKKEFDTGNYSNRWSAEDIVEKKYKPVLDALNGRGGY